MKHFNRVKKYGANVMAAGSGLALTAGVHAADYTAQIGGAETEATANNTMAIGAVIGLAVLGFGVAALVGWLRR